MQNHRQQPIPDLPPLPPLPLSRYLEALGDMVLDFRGDPAATIAGADSDSRLVGPGDLFVAIPGAQLDGAAFIPQAMAAGATAIVSETILETKPPINYVRVSDAYHAAGAIAEVLHRHPLQNLRTVGITGTNGKTTCAFLLRDMLRRAGLKTGLIGTVHYQFGEQTIPASLTTPTPFELQRVLRQMVEARTEWLVMEVSSHALAQHRLGKGQLQAALFTNLTGDHGDYHRSRKNYFQAKQRLFTEHLEKRAPAMINQDDLHGRKLRRLLLEDGSTRPLGFAIRHQADLQVEQAKTTLQGTQFRLLDRQRKRTLSLASPLIGRFNVMNTAGAAALAWELGLPEDEIKQACALFKGAPGRLEPVPGEQDYRVFVDYAHTDDALKNVLQALRRLKPARLSVVFGCGGDRDREKRPRMGRVAARLADRIYLTSDNPRSEPSDTIIEDIRQGIPANADCIIIEDRRQAIRQAMAKAQPGEVILIAGKGHENYQIVGSQRLPFDDRVEALKAMQVRTAGCLGTAGLRR